MPQEAPRPSHGILRRLLTALRGRSEAARPRRPVALLRCAGALVFARPRPPAAVQSSPVQPSPGAPSRLLAARIFGSHWVGNPRFLPM
jgi:hypothetical protein